jgi:hypothetical protein
MCRLGTNGLPRKELLHLSGNKIESELISMSSLSENCEMHLYANLWSVLKCTTWESLTVKAEMEDISRNGWQKNIQLYLWFLQSSLRLSCNSKFSCVKRKRPVPRDFPPLVFTLNNTPDPLIHWLK